jgi:hypothetical protein
MKRGGNHGERPPHGQRMAHTVVVGCMQCGGLESPPGGYRLTAG